MHQLPMCCQSVLLLILSWRVVAQLTTAVHLMQYEREEAGALTKVLDKHQLHARFPLVALEAGLPSVLQVLHLFPP